jgi:excisionase family DNA binding protein
MSKKFDPLKYIESAFLDQPEKKKPASRKPNSDSKTKYRKTAMSAPRPRRKSGPKPEVFDDELAEMWKKLPANFEFLLVNYDDSVTHNYYNSDFKESRTALIRRLLDPELTLAETSRLLGVCPATVRRYTNKGWLEHVRTKGKQRKFRLSHLAKFIETYGRLPEESSISEFAPEP